MRYGTRELTALRTRRRGLRARAGYQAPYNTHQKDGFSRGVQCLGRGAVPGSSRSSRSARSLLLDPMRRAGRSREGCLCLGPIFDLAQVRSVDMYTEQRIAAPNAGRQHCEALVELIEEAIARRGASCTKKSRRSSAAA